MKLVIWICLPLLLTVGTWGCTQIPKREPPTSPNFERNYVTLKSTGLSSLRCEVHFPPLKFLANYLERHGQIASHAADQFRGPYAHVNFFADNTPCLIQEIARPETPSAEAKKTIAHFASVASAATQGTCQMLALGYLSLPIDFTSSRGLWKEDPVTHDWNMKSNGQHVRLSRDFKQIQIDQPATAHPFVVRFGERPDHRLITTEINSHLEGQGPIQYLATYEDITLNGAQFSVPLTTTLVVQREGREGVRMSTEYHCKPGP